MIARVRAPGAGISLQDGPQPPNACDDRYRATVRQMMESQAYRELAAAQMFGYGLRFVPELKWLKFMTWHVQEEVSHFELVARMYKEMTGESVEPFVHERLEKKPIEFAESWLELAMAQFLYDRGGFWQLGEYRECSYLPYRATIARIIDEEAGHQAVGERIVVELCRSGKHEREKQPLFEKWLRQGLLSFGRPGTEAARYAIEVGLKGRDAGEVMKDFIADIKPAVLAAGLVIPDLRTLGIEAPEGMDLSLTGVVRRPSLERPAPPCA